MDIRDLTIYNINDDFVKLCGLELNKARKLFLDKIHQQVVVIGIFDNNSLKSAASLLIEHKFKSGQKVARIDDILGDVENKYTRDLITHMRNRALDRGCNDIKVEH